jgi:hypothetical protein
MFEGQTMLDPFERFLNSPPRVIESAEFIGWVSVGVEERGDEDASLVTEDLENESNLTRLGGDFVISASCLLGAGRKTICSLRPDRTNCLMTLKLRLSTRTQKWSPRCSKAAKSQEAGYPRSSSRRSLRRSLSRCSKSI